MGLFILLPILIVPLVPVDINIYGSRIRAGLIMVRIGVRLKNAGTVIGLYAVFVNGIGINDIGDKAFPYTSVGRMDHSVCITIPVIEVTHNRNRLCIRSPCSEEHSVRSQNICLMSAHISVSMIVLTAVEQVHIRATVVFLTNLHI